MAKLENKEIKFEAPFVKDLEVNRAVTKIYKDLNDLAKSTNNFQLKEEGANTEGKEGDIKVVKSTEDDGYALQICSENGWLEDKTAKYVSINDTVSVKTEQKKKTLPSTVGGLLPAPDFNSGWLFLDWSETVVHTKPPMKITHNLNTFPTLALVYFAPEQGSGSLGDSVPESDITWFTEMDTDTGNSHAHGCSTYISKTEVMIQPGDTQTLVGSNFPSSGNGAGATFRDGAVKVMLWK
jgi:hypothetical protein